MMVYDAMSYYITLQYITSIIIINTMCIYLSLSLSMYIYIYVYIYIYIYIYMYT